MDLNMTKYSHTDETFLGSFPLLFLTLATTPHKQYTSINLWYELSIMTTSNPRARTAESNSGQPVSSPSAIMSTLESLWSYVTCIKTCVSLTPSISADIGPSICIIERSITAPRQRLFQRVKKSAVPNFCLRQWLQWQSQRHPWTTNMKTFVFQELNLATLTTYMAEIWNLSCNFDFGPRLPPMDNKYDYI